MAGAMALPAFGCSQSARKTRSVTSRATFWPYSVTRFRTPLAGIVGMADLLLETPVERSAAGFRARGRPPPRNCWRNWAARCGSRNSRPAMAVLDESEFNLRDAAAVASPRIYQRKAAGQRAFLFPWSSSQGLPDCAHWGCARACGRSSSQVLANAVKFTDEGEIGMRARTDERPVGRRCGSSCEVSDTGIGIAPGELEASSRRSGRARAAYARRYPGLGSGPGAGRAAAPRLMRGEVNVESEPGQGSVISLAVPLRLPPEHVPHKPVSRLHRVLVVDENPVSRRRIRQMLSGRQYDVETVPSREARLPKRLAGATRPSSWKCARPRSKGLKQRAPSVPCPATARRP